MHQPARVAVRQYRDAADAQRRADAMDLVIHARDGTAWVITMTPMIPAS